jgi:hypothetical protein
MNQSKRTRRELRGAIIGMAMGDGSLYQGCLRDGRKSGGYVLDIGHSAKQAAYLEAKRDIVNDLFDYVLPIRARVITHKATGKSYPAVRVTTRVHPRFKFIARRIYVDGRKRITPWVMDNITVEGLAIWWMDDGCLRIYTKKTGGEVIWGLYGFPKEDVERLQDVLVKQFNVYLRLRQNSKMRDRDPNYGWYLSRGISEGRKLLDRLRDFKLPAMDYKFDYERGFHARPFYSLPQTLATAPTPSL